MEILIFLFIIGSIGLVVWGIILSRKGTLLRLPKDGLDIKVQKPGFDFSRLLPSEAFLNRIERYIQQPELFKLHAEINRPLVEPLSARGTAKFYSELLHERLWFDQVRLNDDNAHIQESV